MINFKQINIDTIEGRYLMAAIAKLGALIPLGPDSIMDQLHPIVEKTFPDPIPEHHWDHISMDPKVVEMNDRKLKDFMNDLKAFIVVHISSEARVMTPDPKFGKELSDRLIDLLNIPAR